MSKRKLFDYIVISLLDKISILENSNWEIVGNENNFTRNKLSLLPFMICVANGHTTRETLFSIFDNFTTNDFGIVENEILHDLENVNPIYAIQNNKVVIAPTYINIFATSNFKLIPYFSENTELNIAYSAVDKSIDLLCRRTNMEFPNYTEESLSIDSKKHTIWEVYRFFLKKATKIDKAHLLECMSIYSPDNNLYQISV